jgi:hypothetical protein
MGRTVRRAGALVAAGVLIAGLAACGDDDDGGDEASGSASGAADLSGDGVSSEDAAAFCDAALAADAVSLQLESGEATPDDVEATLVTAEETAPAELTDAVNTMVTDARAMAAAPPEGDGPPPMPSEAYYPASVQVSDYLSANCDLQTVDVTATNYAFDGLDGVEAGTTVLNLDNQGTEFHEFVLMQVAEGEERPFEELMALPEEEVETLVSDKAFVLAPPGAASYVTAELDPGRYIAVCFVPVGATPEALASGAPLPEDDGHFMHGMVAEFEVA